MKALYQIQSLYISLSLLGLSVACSSEPAQKKGSQTKSAPETQTEMATGDSAPAAAPAAAIVAQKAPPSFQYYRFMTSKTGSAYTTVSELQFYWDKVWQANKMTSDSVGTIGDLTAKISAFSSYTVAFLPFKAFDGLLAPASGDNTWISSGDCCESWIQVDLGVNLKNLTAYKITGRNIATQSPVDFHLEASADLKTWTKVGPAMTAQNTTAKTVCVFFPPQTACP